MEHFLFSHIFGIIIPIDEYFSEGLKPPTRLVGLVGIARLNLTLGQEGGLNNSFLARVAAVLAVLSLIGAAYDTWIYDWQFFIGQMTDDIN